MLLTLLFALSFSTNAIRCKNVLIDEGSSVLDVEENCVPNTLYQTKNITEDILYIFYSADGMNYTFTCSEGFVSNIEEDRQ